jgi:hypothetical protein
MSLSHRSETRQHITALDVIADVESILGPELLKNGSTPG